jgi:hypothetical protein
MYDFRTMEYLRLYSGESGGRSLSSETYTAGKNGRNQSMDHSRPSSRQTAAMHSSSPLHPTRLIQQVSRNTCRPPSCTYILDTKKTKFQLTMGMNHSRLDVSSRVDRLQTYLNYELYNPIVWIECLFSSPKFNHDLSILTKYVQTRRRKRGPVQGPRCT